MADRYVRDNIGRFAPTGRATVTATGRRGGIPRGGGATRRSVNGSSVIELRKPTAYQKGKINGVGAVAVARTGLRTSNSGGLTSRKRTNVESMVVKLKKNGYSKNGPSVRSAIRASGARGVQVAANARYVSRTESAGIPGGNIVSRGAMSRNAARQRPTSSGYLVVNSLS